MREMLNKDNHNLTSNSFLLDDDLRCLLTLLKYCNAIRIE